MGWMGGRGILFVFWVKGLSNCNGNPGRKLELIDFDRGSSTFNGGFRPLLKGTHP